MQAWERANPRGWCRCASLVVALWGTTAGQAAGPGFAAVLGGSGQDYAASVASDAAGNTYIAGLTYSPDFRTTVGVFQPKLAGNGSLANPNAIASDTFVAKFAPDGVLLWSTFLGGSGDDRATGVGVDSAGNVLVTGWTRSFDFPTFHALQPTLNNGVSPFRWDAFVTKLDPTGSTLLYSTFLGGPDDDGAYGLAVDAAGNAYVTGSLNVAAGFTGFKSSATGFGIFVCKLDPQGALAYSFFYPNGSFASGLANAAIAVDAAGSAYVTATVSSYYPVSATKTFGPQGGQQAVVFKLSSDGSQKIYETTLGGSVSTNGLAIALDGAGAAYVAGTTTSVDFPLVKPLQSTMGAQPLWSSNNSGATWTPPDELPFAYLQALAVDPTAPNTLYAATSDAGLFKSVDGGAAWSHAGNGITGVSPQVLVMDPQHPQSLYAVTGSGVIPGGVYKTVDGAGNWSVIDSSASAPALQLAVDAQNPSNLYVVWSNITRKSSDGGVTWSNLVFPGTSITFLALDPRISGNIFVFSAAIPGIIKTDPGTPSYIWHSSNGGIAWTKLLLPTPAQGGLMMDGSSNPTTIYNGLRERSIDAGITWTSISPSPVSDAASGIAVDPNGVLYASTYTNGMFTSHDRGLTWTSIGSPVPPTSNGAHPNVLVTIPVGAAGRLFAIVQNVQNSGFVTKLSPDGQSIVYSTFLRGHPSAGAVNTFAAEPGVFLTQNWITAIAVDAAGNVLLVGGTRAVDFPTANPAQVSNAGKADAFLTRLSPDGSKLTYSTYIGGSQDDSALAVTTDAQGNIILAGQTWSTDFPVHGGVQPPAGQIGDAFIVKLVAPALPVVAAVLNGASFQPGIEAGSWVMIQGAGLANSTRTWRGHDFVNGNLPTALDGVSATINGRPAFVYYISPTQINVQAPSDSAVGAVNVVVNNNGAVSAPGTAQLQAVAPAFFLEPGTNNVIASRLPDYAAVGDVAAPSKPGDKVVLWGTGFGATTPAVPAGTTVSGAPAVVTLPTVTVGSVQVQVISTVLTLDSAGLYQVTIQLPANVPTGAVAVQASVGGVQTPAGVTIFIGKP